MSDSKIPPVVGVGRFFASSAKIETPRRRRRRPSLLSATKQARKAGLSVARFELREDGINIIPGKSESSPGTNAANDLDAWLERHRAH
jgi:hypothetical protein